MHRVVLVPVCICFFRERVCVCVVCLAKQRVCVSKYLGFLWKNNPMIVGFFGQGDLTIVSSFGVRNS